MKNDLNISGYVMRKAAEQEQLDQQDRMYLIPLCLLALVIAGLTVVVLAVWPG
jgi:hypothetical protein